MIDMIDGINREKLICFLLEMVQQKTFKSNKSREIRRQISEKNKKTNREKDATYIV